MSRPKNVLALLLAAGALIVSGAAWSQAKYPSRPITIIAGVQAGTGGDVAVRTLAEKMSASLGQSIVIDNQPAAGGVVGAGKGARAAPDGYTISAVTNWIMAIRPILATNLPYDPFKDFIPVGYLSSFPTVLYVHPSLPVTTVKEFVELARKQPGKLTYASPGIGSAQHLGMEQLKAAAGIDLLHIPFQGSTQATTESVAGRVDAGFQGISTVLPFVNTGKLRALAWADKGRFPLMPNLPTMQESGFPSFTYGSYMVLYVPTGTPPEIVNVLNAAVRKASADPELRARWAEAGIETHDFTPAELDALVKEESSRNRKLIQDSGIKID